MNRSEVPTLLIIRIEVTDSNMCLISKLTEWLPLETLLVTISPNGWNINIIYLYTIYMTAQECLSQQTI